MEVDRTFAFVDLCGFTAYTESHGATAATQMLAAFRAASRDISSRRGVRIAKWLGDGCMIVGVEARPVLETLLETEHRTVVGPSTLALRFGVTYGKAILFEGDDYIGSVVNLAKRLCDAAAPHEILIGPHVDTYLPLWAEVSDQGELPIKGFDEPLRRNRLALKPSAHPCVDHVCRLPIDPDCAFTVVGDAVFCSESCLVTWQEREGTDALF